MRVALRWTRACNRGARAGAVAAMHKLCGGSCPPADHPPPARTRRHALNVGAWGCCIACMRGCEHCPRGLHACVRRSSLLRGRPWHPQPSVRLPQLPSWPKAAPFGQVLQPPSPPHRIARSTKAPTHLQQPAPHAGAQAGSAARGIHPSPGPERMMMGPQALGGGKQGRGGSGGGSQ